MAYRDVVFRYRFWLFGATFVVGFGLARVDPVNVTVALLHFVAPSLDLDTGTGLAVLRTAFSVGAVCLVAAALVRTWATAYLDTSVVHDSRLHTEALVANGPYRHVRNPLYLGGILLGVGMAMLASRLGAVVIIVGVLAITLSLIDTEEYELAAAHPASYEAYRRAVPRLLPSIAPRTAPAGAAPRWRQAFLGEAMFWLFAAGMIAFVITLQPLWFIGFSIAAPLLHLLIIGTWRRAAAARSGR